MKMRYGALSDQGDVRTENQDRILALTGMVAGKETGLFVVADGMGGLSYGSAVSAYIIESFSRWWEEDFPEMAQAGKCKKEEIKELLEQEIWDVNQEVFAFCKRENCRSGSTLSVLFIYDGHYYIVNMGDSRIYHFQNGELKRLTEDQSMAAQLVREKKLTEEEAKRSGKNHILTMCIGMVEIPRSFYTEGTLNKGDCFLLCSDGFYNEAEEQEVCNILNQNEIEPQKKAHFLRNLIQPGKAGDNVSEIIVEIME